MRPVPPPAPWRAATLAVLVLGAALRLVALDRAPPGLHFDEAVYGLMARDIAHGARPVFFSAYTGREPLYMYLVAVVFRAVGETAFGIRLTSALIGVLTLAATHALAARLHGARTATAATALLAASYWHVTVSRNGYPNVLIPPLTALCLLFLWRGWTTGRARDFLAAGAFGGLVLYTYLAARFVPVLLLLLLLYAAAVAPARLRRRRRGVALAAGALALVAAPLAIHFARHPADLLERANQVALWNAHHADEFWAVLGDNIRRTLLGFAVLGDSRWHFNLPGRPIYTPAVAAAAALGLAVCLRRARDPRFGLAPLWIVVMSLPGVLTDEVQPATQRMFGVFPALVLLPAIGLVAAGDWLAARWPSAAGPGRRAARAGRAAALLPAALVALVAAGDGARTARDYFGEWARRPETAAIFNADYVAMAAAARADLAAGRRPVLLSEHYKHATIAFQAPELVDGAVWADPRLALPLPPAAAGATGAAARVYYRPAAYPPGDAPATRWLEAHDRAAARRVIAPHGAGGPLGPAPAVLRYEVPALAPPASPAGDAGARVFHGEVAVAAAPGGTVRVERGDALALAVPWTVVGLPPDGRGFALHLHDALGTTWAQADVSGFLTEQWRVGDTVLGWFPLTLDETMPPGRYTAQLMLVDAAARPLPWRRAAATTAAPGEPEGGVAAVVAAVAVAPGDRARLAPGDRTPAALGDALAVLAASAPAEGFVPGGRPIVEVRWARVGPGAPPPRVRFVLTPEEGAPIDLGTRAVAAGYPPARWEAGEILRHRYALRLPPELAPGPYRLAVEAPGGAGRRELAALVVGGGPRRFDPPPVAHAVDVVLGGALRLVGWEAAPAVPAPGRPLTVTLVWTADAPPAGEATVFVHLFGPDGRPVAQHDGPPDGGRRPLAGWLPGEFVVDRHVLDVPAGAAPSALSLGVGLYDPQSGARWPAVVRAGARAEDDRVTLATPPAPPGR